MCILRVVVSTSVEGEAVLRSPFEQTVNPEGEGGVFAVREFSALSREWRNALPAEASIQEAVHCHGGGGVPVKGAVHERQFVCLRGITEALHAQAPMLFGDVEEICGEGWLVLCSHPECACKDPVDFTAL
jgi:hypothetical protein